MFLAAMSTAALTHNDPAERKDRQLAQAQEIQALTMRLARAAAAKAEAALLQPEPEPQPGPRPKPRDHVLDFVRLTRALNQTMAIENRIANDDYAPRTSSRSRSAPTSPPTSLANPPGPPDRRRDLLREAFYDATKTYADKAQRRRDIDASVDEHLATDPDRTKPAHEFLKAVSDDVQVPIDFAKLTDEILGMPDNRPGRRMNL